MRATLLRPDLSDPLPVYSGMSDEELLNRHKWFKRLCNPFLLGIGEKLALLANFLPEWLYKNFAKRTIYKFFVGGETLTECQYKIDELYDKNIGSVLDLSVESASSLKEVNKAIQLILQTINLANINPEKIPFTVFKITGLVKKQVLISISIKLKMGKPFTDAETKNLNIILNRVDKLCHAAYMQGVKIMIDAEETWIQDIIDHVALIMMKRYNKNKVTVINTYQMYSKNGISRLKNDFNTAKSQGFELGVKLVRGAYMEIERKRAIKYKYTCPINSTKEDTDNHYKEGLKFCIKNINSILLVAGTHNKESVYFLITLIEEYGLPRTFNRIHFSQLYGMGDILSYNLSKHGFNVCKYLPFGPVKDVIPYLTRRARENSSVKGFKSQELQNILSEISRRQIILN